MHAVIASMSIPLQGLSTFCAHELGPILSVGDVFEKALCANSGGIQIVQHTSEPRQHRDVRLS